MRSHGLRTRSVGARVGGARLPWLAVVAPLLLSLGPVVAERARAGDEAALGVIGPDASTSLPTTTEGVSTTSSHDAVQAVLPPATVSGGGAHAVLHKVHKDSRQDKEVGMMQGMTVIAFLLFFVGTIQMLQYPDPQVRSYSYKTVFATVSIFEALSFVTIQNEVFMALFVDPYVGGSKSMLRHAISVVVFLSWFAAMSAICWQVRRYPAKLFAASGILSHLVAFTLVEASANAQMDESKQLLQSHGLDYVYAVYAACPIVSLISFVILRAIAVNLRRKLAPPPQHEGTGEPEKQPDAASAKKLAKFWMQNSGVMATEEGEAHRKWMQETDEAEHQTGASVTGFFVSRLCYCIAVGRVPPVDCEKDQEYGCDVQMNTVWTMCLCTAILYAITIAATASRDCILRSFAASDAEDHHSEPKPEEPQGDPSDANEKPPGQPSDTKPLEQPQPKPAPHSQSTELVLSVLANIQLSLLMAISWCILVITRWLLNDGIPGGATGHRVVNAFVMSPLCFAVIIFMDKLADLGWVTADTAEAFMKSFALCVGLEWEKAVAASMEAAIDVSAIGQAHPALCQLTMCAVLAAALLPVWMWFIVPRALLPVPPRDPLPSASSEG